MFTSPFIPNHDTCSTKRTIMASKSPCLFKVPVAAVPFDSSLVPVCSGSSELGSGLGLPEDSPVEDSDAGRR